jgi:hypothetical protein
MNKRIKEPTLFHETSIRKVGLGEQGVTFLVGQLKDGGLTAVQSIEFDDKHWNSFQIADWMGHHADKVQLGALLPDEAASLWLAVYNEACIAGASSDEAASSAWAKVKDKWYQDRNGSWVKFAETWQKAILSNDRPTIEIFKTGDYPQFVTKDNPKGTVTESDIDTMVNNFDKHNTIPVTIDHQSAGPALGWVDRIWRDGKTLYATMRNLVTDFAKDIKSGKYVNRSVEIMPNLSLNGERIGMTLMAVTFLGAITPQVKGMLAPKFEALFSRFKHRGGGLVFSIDDNKAIFELSEKYLTQPNQPKGDTLEMTHEQVEKLKQDAADAAVAKVKVEFEDKLKVEQAKTAKLETAAEEAKKEQIGKDAETAYAKLAEKGKILPAGKDRFIALFKGEAEAGRDPQKSVVPLFAELPDKINLTELTKNSDTTIKSLKDMPEYANATEESVTKLEKMYAYMDANKMDRKNAVHIKLASAHVDQETK